MAQNKINSVYYGTTDANKNYETEEENGTIILGNIETEGNLVDEYTCNATVNITLDGEMQSALQENDLVLVITQGETINTIDLSEDITSPTFSFDLKQIEPIKAYLKFTNQDADQSGIAGKELNITININDFVCEIKKSALPVLKSTTSPEYLKEAVENDELLRYVGTYEDVNEHRLNNYICFGTNDKSTCTENPDTYMYRIIGITTENVNQELGLVPNQLKIIKATPLKEDNGNVKTMKWASNDNSSYNYTWDYLSTSKDTGAILRYYLNNDFNNIIKDAIPNGTYWDRIITNNLWYNEDYIILPIIEPTSSKTYSIYKIGIMYATDYKNSFNYASDWNTTNSWLHLKNGISESSKYDQYEWTMSRYGNGYGYYTAWHVRSSGALNAGYGVTEEYAVRPVFYLIPDIALTGEGTESNPFIISEV